MKKLLLSMFAVATLYSCSNSDDDTTIPTNPDEKYLNGFFITNEGNFTKANASVSHLSADYSNFTEDVFKAANGKQIGDVAQSMVVTDKYVFVVVNNSNTIEVVNKKTFKSVHTITEGLNSPRYAVISNNKLYVTSLFDASVAVYNAETFAFIKSIPLNFTSEKIVATNEYVYAANGFYSTGKLVEVIDPKTDTNTVDITFENAINGITTAGEFTYVLETNDSESKISKVSGTSAASSVAVNQAGVTNLTADGNNLYYTAGTGIYKLNNSLANSGSKLFDVAKGDDFSVLYGFNVINGTIFTSDAKGFTDKSLITIYNESGSKLKELTGGIGANGFYKF